MFIVTIRWLIRLNAMTVEYRGLAAPVNKNNGGYFVSARLTELIWSSIYLIVFTEVGSMPGRRKFGTHLTGFLFEQMPSASVAELQSMIAAVIAQQESRVYVNSVTVSKNENQLNVKITLSFKFNSMQDTRNINFSL